MSTFFKTGLLIPLLFCAQALAQPRVQPSLDVAQFRDREHVNYLEISYAVPRHLLAAQRYARNDSLAFAVALELRIYREHTLWTNKTWKLAETVAASDATAATKDWVDVLRYVLDEAPAFYRAVLLMKDLNSAAPADSAEVATQTQAFGRTELALSDVLLAADIRKAAAAQTGALLKNGYEIIAPPRLIFGEGRQSLFYYFEAYNLDAALRGEHYKSYWHVENENGGKVEEMAGVFRSKRKLHESSIEMGTVNLASLPTGVYAFVYGLADSSKNLLATRRKKFYVFHGEPVAQAVPANGAHLLAHVNEAELDDEFDRMQHLVKPEDKKLFLGLNNLEAKRNFVASLWETLKPEEYAEARIFRSVYLARARYAETQFPSALRPGWKGDRGRVYILYGPPSHVERETSNPNTKPYEIWRYDDLQGGVIFVFADRTGFKNYELLHSTHRNELQNPDWERSVSLGTGSNWGR